MATTTAAAPRSRFRLPLPEQVSALSEPDFRTVWIGSAVSMTGTWMQVVAQGLVVLELWDSPFALGAANFANAVPALIVMLFGGVLADQADKRRILVVTQGIMAMLAAAIGVLILTDQLEFWMLLVATGLLGVAFGYDMPAYQALLPELVPPEKISQVMGLNSSTFHGSRMVGPAIATAVIGVMGFAAAYFINAASFVAVILSLMIIRYRATPRSSDAPRASAMQGLREGIAHARARPNLRVLLLLTALCCGLLFPVLAILSPAYVEDVLDGGSTELGLMLAASGVGSLIGALTLIWWSREYRKERIWAGTLAAPVFLAVMAFTRDPLVAIISSGVVSLSFSMQLGVFGQIMQESTPGPFRGRVMSLNGLTFNGAMPIGGLLAAALAVAIGLPAVMLVAGGVYLVLAVLILRTGGGGIDAVVRASHVEYEAVLEAHNASQSTSLH